MGFFYFMKAKVYLILGLVIAVLAVFFTFQNFENVTVRFFRWEWQSNVALLILTSMLLGVVISWLISMPSAIGNFFRKMGMKFEVQKLEKKLKKSHKTSAKISEEKSRLEKNQELLEQERRAEREGIEKIEA